VLFLLRQGAYCQNEQINNGQADGSLYKQRWVYKSINPYTGGHTTVPSNNTELF